MHLIPLVLLRKVQSNLPMSTTRILWLILVLDFAASAFGMKMSSSLQGIVGWNARLSADIPLVSLGSRISIFLFGWR